MSALAQEAPVEISPARQCADAARGREVEVCLRLAAAHPDDVDAIAAALKAHLDRASSDDRDLLHALLALVSEGGAVQGAERLGALDDPRVVSPLVHAARTRAGPVAVAAAEALALHPEALPELRSLVSDPAVPLEVRLAAVRTLGTMGTAAAGDVLVDELRRPLLPPALRREMIATVRDTWPERSNEIEGQVTADGTGWLALAGAGGLGYALATAGYFGQSDLEALGGVTGALVGTTAGYLYGRAFPMEAGDAALIATSGIGGTGAGLLIAAGVAPRDEDALWAGGLAGEAVGFGLSGALRGVHPGTAGDALEATWVSGWSALGAATGIAYARQDLEASADQDPPALAAGLALTGGLAVGHAVAPGIDVSVADLGLIGVASGYGAAFGALVPLRGRSALGLPITTLSTGAVLGYALAGPVEAPADVLFGAAAGGTYGGVFGAGVGMLVDIDDRDVVTGSGLAGATLGLGVGAAVAARDPDPIDDRDLVLTGLATGWATWQAIGWGTWSQGDPSLAGLLVMAPPAVGIATGLISPVTDVPVTHSMMSGSLGVWGAYLGGVSSELVGGDTLLWTLVGSDAALAGGSLLLSPLVGVSPFVVGVADAGGVLGGATGTLALGLASPDPEPVLVGSLVGAGVGFAGGAVLGARLQRRGPRNVALLGRVRVPGTWTLGPLRAEATDAYGVELRGVGW